MFIFELQVIFLVLLSQTRPIQCLQLIDFNYIFLFKVWDPGLDPTLWTLVRVAGGSIYKIKLLRWYYDTSDMHFIISKHNLGDVGSRNANTSRSAISRAANKEKVFVSRTLPLGCAPRIFIYYNVLAPGAQCMNARRARETYSVWKL